ncbi:ATP-dependent protease HslVU (ClpYQ), peptidase subunit [Rhizobium leguminosarum bv. trifolii WSM2012]|nr:ATP-dependent protease HslVU (ClpYQ), peptidase subunit [Rhizobium leguminosarum bv. trifolii WSM2012]
MTTIVYHCKHRLMVADSRATCVGNRPIGTKMKIHRIAAGPAKGALLGVSTQDPGTGEWFRDWVTAGMSAEAYGTSGRDFEALLAKVDGSVLHFESSPYPSGPLKNDFYAIGSGSQYAHGALMAGADPIAAVTMAIGCDVYSGPPIVTLQLDTLDANQTSFIQRFIRLLRYSGSGTATYPESHLMRD